MSANGLFASKDACMQRQKHETRAEMMRVNDIQEDMATVESRLRSYMAANPLENAPDESNNRIFGSMVETGYRKTLGLAAHVHSTAVINTFHYIFHNHQRGVFVSIRRNRVRMFMTFHNKKWRNPLASIMRLDPAAKSVMEAQRVKDPVFNPSAVWTNIGCLVNRVAANYHPPHIEEEMKRSPGWEVNYHHRELKSYYERVCETTSVPDCDFFLNYFDRLLLKVSPGPVIHSPYDHIVGDQTWVHKRARAPMIPIVSMCTRDGYLDMPSVTPDDIIRVSGQYAPPRCSNPYADASKYELDWSKKRPTAVFRGADTGCGWTVETNQRLAVVQLAHQHNKESSPLLDAELTGHENLFKKHRDDRYVRYHIDKRVPRAVDAASVMLTMAEQTRYKYVIYIEGNVAAYRLAGMFATGSLVLFVQGDGYKLWFHPLLKHMENCIVVPSVQELPDVIRWCRENDGQCERMAKSGLEMHNQHLATERDLIHHGNLLLRSIASASRKAD